MKKKCKKFVQKIQFFFLIISFATFNLTYSYYIPSEENINKTFSNFSFGSCFLGYLSERDDMFKTINENNPDLWVWLGDAAYIDKININYLSSSISLDIQFAEKMFNNVKSEKCNF